jgi:Acyl-CoA reductase (LuxC)
MRKRCWRDGRRADVNPGSLRALPARRIVAQIADAAERWSDADFPPRVRATAAVEARLGYSTPVVEYALDRIFFGITTGALEAAIASELGSVAALDGFAVRANAPAAWARGVDRAVIISSDTTIGVALVPAIFALCAKCDVVVKDRSDALIGAFFASLAQEHPAFVGAARAHAWTGGDDPGEATLFATADVVAAFGGEAALRVIRERCGVETRFVPFGHRASIGRLTRDDVARLDDTQADAIVRDALLYDGEGCLSLHALFVEAGGDALEHLTRQLAAAGERMTLEFPAGTVPPEREAAAGAYRNLAAFRAASGGLAVVVRGGSLTLAIAPPSEPPPFLPRVLPLIAIDSDHDVAAYVTEQRMPVQALGVMRRDERDAALAERIGAVRIAPFGTMQDPPLAGHHGGFPRIADFVRWTDRE